MAVKTDGMSTVVSHPPDGRIPDRDPLPVGTRVILVAHLDHDDDSTVRTLAAGLGPHHDVTLVHVRPSAPSAAAPPPCMLMSDLGVIIYDDWYRAARECEHHYDTRAAARSALLHEFGIDHAVETVTTHRSLFSRRTRRSLRRAIERIADHARADVIRVGPGANTSASLSAGTSSPSREGVDDRHLPSVTHQRGADGSSAPEVRVGSALRRDDDRRMLDELWIDVGGSG